MTRFLACIALLFFLAPGTFVRDSKLPRNDTQIVNIRSIDSETSGPVEFSGGELRYLGGWELTSKNSDFGGFSALMAQADDRFLALSDAGVLMGFRLGSDGQARDSFIAALPVRKGDSETKYDNDSEGMTFDPRTGQFWVSYEQKHAIRRFARSFSRLEGVAKPEVMQKWPDNGGAEAMVRLRDGRFLVFSEAGDGPVNSNTALLYTGDPLSDEIEPQVFGYQPPKGFRITDIAELPDGKLIVLNRRFAILSGVSAKIGVLDPASIAKGKIVTPRIIATLDAPFPVDNMEGIAVSQQDENIVIWLISDDNFNSFQRTILLKFRYQNKAVAKD